MVKSFPVWGLWPLARDAQVWTSTTFFIFLFLNLTCWCCLHPFVFVPVFTHLHKCFFFIPFICVWAAWKSKRWLLKEHDYVKSSRGKIEMYVMHIKYVSLTTKLTEVTGFLFRTSLEHAFSFAWKEKFFVLLSLLVWTPLWTSSDYPRLVWASQCMCTWRYAYERPGVIRIHICIPVHRRSYTLTQWRD